MKKIILISLILAIFLVGAGAFYFFNLNRNSPSETSLATESDQQIETNKENFEIQDTNTVPLPSPEDIIRLFFDLLNEHRAPDAISLLTTDLLGDVTSQNNWLKQFEAIRWVKIQDISKTDQENDQNKQQFLTIINIDVIADDNAPIPFYGWQDNPNWRWITLEKQADGRWLIAEIATGP